jgi:hypothetical protein
MALKRHLTGCGAAGDRLGITNKNGDFGNVKISGLDRARARPTPPQKKPNYLDGHFHAGRSSASCPTTTVSADSFSSSMDWHPSFSLRAAINLDACETTQI